MSVISTYLIAFGLWVGLPAPLAGVLVPGIVGDVIEMTRPDAATSPASSEPVPLALAMREIPTDRPVSAVTDQGVTFSLFGEEGWGDGEADGLTGPQPRGRNGAFVTLDGGGEERGTMLVTALPVCAEPPCVVGPVLYRPPFRTADAIDGMGTLPERAEATSFEGDIGEAWYLEPTREYAHGILGDAIEAKALGFAIHASGTAEAETAHIRLPEGQVFEDIVPRIVDLDSDGANEIVTIQSDVRSGGSIAVYGFASPAGGTFRLIGRTPTIGTPNRWLNVAATIDLDRDGVRDVVVVETPHIGGELQAWSGASILAGEPSLLKGGTMHGFSNHAIGSRAMDLAEVVEVALRPGGIAEPVLLVPSANRRAIRAVHYGQAEGFRELGRIDLPSPVATDIVPLNRSPTAQGATILFATADGVLREVATDCAPLRTPLCARPFQ